MANILYVSRKMDLGGTEKVILSLCKAFKNDFDHIYVCSCGGKNVETLNQMGIEHINIPDFSSKNILNIFRAKRIIKKAIKNKHIDIVHTHHRMAAFICKGLKGVKLVNTIHNTFTDKKKLTHSALNHYTNVACGKAVYDNFHDFYQLDVDKLVLIQNSIECDFKKEIIPEIEQAKKNGLTTFAFVGRFTAQKGIDILLEGFKNIKNSLLFVYGSGEQEYLIDEYKGENIKKMGYTSNPLNVVSQVDCLILPSLWEGLPLNLIESLAVGTPVVCSDIDSNIEIIEDQKEGFVFKCGDASSLEECLNKFIACDNKSALKASALNKYQVKYSFEIFIKKYGDVYRKVLEK